MSSERLSHSTLVPEVENRGVISQGEVVYLAVSSIVNLQVLLDIVDKFIHKECDLHD